MNANDLIEEIRTAILELVKEKYNQRSKEIENEVDTFLQDSKDKFVRWITLLKDGKLKKEEFALLMNSQKDIFVIKTLYQAGISKISLGHLKNNIIDIILNAVFKLIL